MLHGLVIGTAVATGKHESMNERKLMLVQPQMVDGKSPDGDPQIAIDGVGAGVGQRVILTSDGYGARQMLGVDATPVRWTIIGIDDE